jgi:hypothetical protein
MVGYLTSNLLAMARRVTLRHSAQPLTVDNMALWYFPDSGGCPLLRVMADIPIINAYAAVFRVALAESLPRLAYQICANLLARRKT